MTDETTLLSCPFCGGEAHMSASSDGYGVQCWNRRCIDMQLEEIPTEAEAIAAWNTRAERTCHDASVDSSTQFYCSECECTVDVPLLWGEVNYCPNCGAKVVSE